MGSYSVIFKRSVEKDIRRLPKPAIERIFQRIDRLVEEPRPRLSVKLTGADRLYRIRVGDYRVIYEVTDETRIVTILYVRHRRDAYRSA